jgi:hypothetical protein
VRTRENNTEFGISARAGKSLRLALGSLVFKAKDSKVTSRLMKTMSAIRKFDTGSARGSRQVYKGLSTPDGKLALQGFDFNANATLNNVLFTEYDLSTSSGVVSLLDFIPLEQLRFPEGATHVSFQSAVLGIDLATEVSELAMSNVVNLPLSLTAAGVTLTPTSVPTTSGVTLFLLAISFFQEVNGQQYSLKNEAFNVLHVLEVV